MKKLGLFLIGFLFFCQPAFANAEFAYVNILKVYEDTGILLKLNKAQKEFEQKKKAYQDEFSKKNKSFVEQAKNKKSESEVKNLKAKYEKELVDKQNKVVKDFKSKQKNLLEQEKAINDKIKKAVGEIAKQKNIKYVLNQQIMYFGGTDITDDVIKAIKK